MKNIIYITLLAISIISLTSCDKDTDLIKSETDTIVTVDSDSSESVEMTLEINGRSVITSNAKGSFCNEFENDDKLVYAGITNTDYYISELSELNDLELEVGQYIILHLESNILDEDVSVGLLMARVDLGEGPIDVISGWDFLGSNIQFDALGQSTISGSFSGNIYLVEEEIDIIIHNQGLGNFELSFATTDIESCP